MFSPATAIVGILVASVIPLRAETMEWLSSEELESSCEALIGKAMQAEGAPCIAYVQGFLAATDSIVETAGDESPGVARNNETFAERAARTRLGSLRMMRIRGPNTDYCLARDTSAVAVVEKVATFLEKHPETLKLTDTEALHNALSYHFPCEPE